MQDMRSFERGLSKSQDILDEFLARYVESGSDGEDYTTFYSILGVINGLMVVLGKYGEIPMTEVSKQILEETEALLQREGLV